MLYKLGVKQILEGLRTKQFSLKEITDSQIQQIEKNEFNAFVHFDFQKTSQQIKESEIRIENKEPLPLDGIMIGIKDLFCTKNIKTTACSNILHNFIPPYESTTTQRLWSHGAIFAGKLNMDEFAMGSTTTRTIFNPTINPWSKKYGKNLTSGGSSGGSAAAVASLAVPASIGSDTGGSVRQPAAFCGIVGIKPTYGRCSRWGMIAFASSLDCPGVFARNVEDTAIVLQSIAGFDSKDSTTYQVDKGEYCNNINGGIKNLSIGLPKQYFQEMSFDEETTVATKRAIQILKDNGAIIKEIDIPSIKDALIIYYIISSVEAMSNLSRYDGIRYGLQLETPSTTLQDLYSNTRTKGFGEEVKRRLLIGGKILNSELYTHKYKIAQALRRMLCKEFQSIFKKVDCIISPTTPSPVFEIDAKLDEITIYKNDLLTTPANMAGLPAISIPIGKTKDNRPLGLQIMANHFKEEILFKTGKILEDEIEFDNISEII